MDKTLVDKVLAKIDPSKFDLTGAKPETRPEEGAGVRRTIGETLVEAKKITRAQLDEALRKQSERPGRIGELLVEAEAINHNELQLVLAQQFDLPYYESLPASEIDPDLVRNLSRSFCLQNMIIPVSRDNYGVTIAVVDPLALSPVDDLRLIMGQTVFRIVCPKPIIEAVINSLFERQDMSESATTLKSGEDEDGIDTTFSTTARRRRFAAR
jgi:type IV pilus assembly protein PilB